MLVSFFCGGTQIVPEIQGISIIFIISYNLDNNNTINISVQDYLKLPDKTKELLEKRFDCLLRLNVNLGFVGVILNTCEASLIVRLISQMVQYVSFSEKDAILKQQMLYFSRLNKECDENRRNYKK